MYLVHSVLLCFFTLYVSSQTFEIPQKEILKKHHVKKIKVRQFWLYDNDTVINKNSTTIYRFNKKGLLVKEKQKFVTYRFKYDRKENLIEIREKWKMFTNAWFQGEGKQCTIFEYDDLTKEVKIREYGRKYRRRLKSQCKPNLIAIAYRDSLSRDTLVRTLENNWYYASKTDTGYIKNHYHQLDTNLIEWVRESNFPRNQRTDVKHIRLNSFKQVIDVFNLPEESKCSRNTYEYKDELLFRVNYYNCNKKIGYYDLYAYSFFL